MKKSVTQEFDYGCGVAYFAFARSLTYQQAVQLLGREQTVKHGWKPSDLVQVLCSNGLLYKNTYVRKKDISPLTYPDGTTVLIERSSSYPVGHYLIKHENQWMDPWINMTICGDITQATSSFRHELPGKAMYALVPSA